MQSRAWTNKANVDLYIDPVSKSPTGTRFSGSSRVVRMRHGDFLGPVRPVAGAGLHLPPQLPLAGWQRRPREVQHAGLGAAELPRRHLRLGAPGRDWGIGSGTRKGSTSWLFFHTEVLLKKEEGRVTPHGLRRLDRKEEQTHICP